ncbi:ATP-binding protein, partial [Actinoalloteichus spitiensis]|uniref:ATP-binding protein n=1 Tax=Actinoalloteichus spitiensis TaxID=252394 RepID=UPI000474709E
ATPEWPPTAPAPATGNGTVSEQRHLTVVMVMTTAEHAAAVEGFVCQQIRHHGGQPAPGPGSSWCGYFGASGRLPDHADRALAAAGAIARRSVVEFHPAEVRVAVHSGEAVVSRPVDGDTAVPKVAAVVLDSCRRLAAAATPGRVVLNTAPPEGPVGHGPFAARQPAVLAAEEPPGSWHGPTPFVGRSFELDLLQRTVVRTHATGRPAMATLLGARGIGKTRLVSELVDQLRDGTLNTTRVLRTRVRPGCGDAGTVLSALVHDQPGNGVEALRCLASQQPTLVVVDDVHHGADDLLSALATLLDTTDPLPLMIVTTAREEFARRMPETTTGPNSLSLVLDRLTDHAITRLLDVVLSPRRRQLHFGPPHPAAASGQWQGLLDAVRGCPLRALEYAARFNAAEDDQAAHTEGLAGFARFSPREVEAGAPVPAVAALPG